MYRVILERRVIKEIKSLHGNIFSQVMNSLEQLKSNPRPRGVKKLIGDIGWRVRIGKYRILYSIDDSQRVVSIYRIKHRRESYR